MSESSTPDERSEQVTDDVTTTGTTSGTVVDDEDEREEVPPQIRWLPRALFMVTVAVFFAAFCWYAFFQLRSLIAYILIAFFLSLALEPIILWLVRHGWQRSRAAGVTVVGFILVIVVLIVVFGKIFVDQVVGLLRNAPNLYDKVAVWLSAHVSVSLPTHEEILHKISTEWADDLANGVVGAGRSLVSGLVAFTTILLVVYSLCSAGPKFRQAICSRLRPAKQQEVLTLWEVAQRKASDFISSRMVLAALSAFFTTIFLMIMGTPYALALGLFTGIVSQFVPTIGTYIGGALPVIVALTSQGVPQAVAVLVFIILYQQVENYVFSPKVSAQALEMNPAVAFLVVVAFGAVFGAVGAFLALPIAATVQAVLDTYWKRHELIDSRLLHDPEPEQRSGPKKPSRPGRRTSGSAGAGQSSSGSSQDVPDESPSMG